MTLEDIHSPRSTTLTLEPVDTARLAKLCGQLNCNLSQIGKRLGIDLHNRGGAFHLQGPTRAVTAGKRVLRNLYQRLDDKAELLPEDVHLELINEDSFRPETENDSGITDADTELALGGGAIRLQRRSIEPRSPNQQHYVEAIRRHDINFGTGPAGTGKTHLAVACAVEAMQQHRVQRIVLTRPAVEAGERLGFLPGDLNQKINPYLQPLYDALFQLLGPEETGRLIDRSIIEVVPLAYMRGRTLSNAFVILDEAQNTTPAQIIMFLTRIGFDSIAVVNGDLTQTDLPNGQQSGLEVAIHRLQDVKGLSFTHFQRSDIVRHPLIRAIVSAWGQRSGEPVTEGTDGKSASPRVGR